MTGSQLYPIYI